MSSSSSTACQTSKRRCDQRLPRCSRCAQRNQDCVYPSLAALREPSTAPALSSTSRPVPPHSIELNIPLSHFDAVLPGSAPVRAVPVITGSPNPWPLFFDAQGPASQYRHLQAGDGLGSEPVIHVSLAVGRGRVMSLQNTHLYGSSLLPALKDAYAVCAAYAMKNHLNSSLVLGIVEPKADSLLYDPKQLTWTPLQQLAAVQSLVMYQLIRWFDGDIRQRALADQAEAVFDSWTEGLLARVGQRLFDRNQEGNLLVVSPPPEPGDTGLGSGGRVSPGMEFAPILISARPMRSMASVY
ncbi:C6 finger domain-containing protein [Seiridium cupressi]